MKKSILPFAVVALLFLAGCSDKEQHQQKDGEIQSLQSQVMHLEQELSLLKDDRSRAEQENEYQRQISDLQRKLHECGQKVNQSRAPAQPVPILERVDASTGIEPVVSEVALEDLPPFPLEISNVQGSRVDESQRDPAASEGAGPPVISAMEGRQPVLGPVQHDYDSGFTVRFAVANLGDQAQMFTAQAGDRTDPLRIGPDETKTFSIPASQGHTVLQIELGGVPERFPIAW